jgi:serine protease Do
MKLNILTRSIRYALALPLAVATMALADNKLPDIKIDETPLQRTAQNSLAPIVEKVSPSVVTISINKNMAVGRRGQRNQPFLDDPFFRRFFGAPDEDDNSKGGDKGDSGKSARKRPMQVGLGSGVIVSPDGYILTNNHVVEQADEIIVTLPDGKTEYKAKKIGTDPGSDIAVIKVEAAGLKAITIANSDKIKVGDIVIAIGNPFALRQSVTSGIISATGRNQTGISDFGNFIQTDAAINPGNSGGALVDAEGRLIGINTAIFSRSGGSMGIGFAVPSNQARSAMESLIKFGKVQRGFLGIQMQELDDKLAKEFRAPNKSGILVTEVVNGGGAEKGGVKSGDVVTEMNGQPVGEIADFRNAIASMVPGTTVDLKLYRNGEAKVLKITLAERSGASVASLEKPEAEPEAKAPDVLDGVTVGDLRPEIRQQYNIPEGVVGAVVTAVNPDCPSADAEIKAGDVIVEIDGKGVKNSDDAVRLSEEVKTKNSVRLRVSSRGTTKFVVVEERKEN